MQRILRVFWAVHARRSVGYCELYIDDCVVELEERSRSWFLCTPSSGEKEKFKKSGSVGRLFGNSAKHFFFILFGDDDDDVDGDDKELGHFLFV